MMTKTRLKSARQSALAAMFREAAVLLYVFPVLDSILDPRATTVWFLVGSLVVATGFAVLGIYLEEANQ